MKRKIKENLIFGVNFLKNPVKNASIVPSSKYASVAMVKNIDFSKVETIVELGPGTGVFTEEILKKAKPNTKIILVEIEKTYLKILRDKFGDRVIVENASAHLLDEILAKHNIEKIDLIISAVPSLPKEIGKDFFSSIKRQTDRGAIFRFITLIPPVMKMVYKNLPIRKISFVSKNFPPLWIYGIN